MGIDRPGGVPLGGGQARDDRALRHLSEALAGRHGAQDTASLHGGTCAVSTTPLWMLPVAAAASTARSRQGCAAICPPRWARSPWAAAAATVPMHRPQCAAAAPRRRGPSVCHAVAIVYMSQCTHATPELEITTNCSFILHININIAVAYLAAASQQNSTAVDCGVYYFLYH
jgi:hypothetical protein